MREPEAILGGVKLVPTSFPEENIRLDAPSELSSEQCESLTAYQGFQEDGMPVTVTCWKFTREDLEQLHKTGRLWLVYAGHEVSPIYPTTESPFSQNQSEEESNESDGRATT